MIVLALWFIEVLIYAGLVFRCELRGHNPPVAFILGVLILCHPHYPANIDLAILEGEAYPQG